jgi:hypothetical protein
MLCVSELRGLQEFQAKHPEAVVVAISVDDATDSINKVLQRNKLDALRVAVDKSLQSKFGLSDAIPVTVIADGGKVRVIHDSVLDDPVLILEADLAAIRAGSANSH